MQIYVVQPGDSIDSIAAATGFSTSAIIYNNQLSYPYALAIGQLNLYTIAWSALLSYLSIPIGQVLIFLKEWMCWVINRLMPR